MTTAVGTKFAEIMARFRAETDAGKHQIRVLGNPSTIGSMVLVDGEEVRRVQDIVWRHKAGELPELHVSLNCPVLEANADGADIQYHGLEQIPSEALRQELARREEAP